MSDKRTRKDWALAFGVSYQIMADAIARKIPDKRQRESTFDEKTARDALIGYYAWQRERRLRKVLTKKSRPGWSRRAISIRTVGIMSIRCRTVKPFPRTFFR